MTPEGSEIIGWIVITVWAVALMFGTCIYCIFKKLYVGAVCMWVGGMFCSVILMVMVSVIKHSAA